MIRFYKNVKINIIPSRYNNFWYEVIINGINYGQERSIESAIEFGDSVVDSAINDLYKIDQSTVIDNVWGAYFEIDENSNILKNLLLLSGLDNYEEILAKYEGFDIGDFLNKFK